MGRERASGPNAAVFASERSGWEGVGIRLATHLDLHRGCLAGREWASHARGGMHGGVQWGVGSRGTAAAAAAWVEGAGLGLPTFLLQRGARGWLGLAAQPPQS